MSVSDLTRMSSYMYQDSSPGLAARRHALLCMTSGLNSFLHSAYNPNLDLIFSMTHDSSIHLWKLDQLHTLKRMDNWLTISAWSVIFDNLLTISGVRRSYQGQASAGWLLGAWKPPGGPPETKESAPHSPSQGHSTLRLQAARGRCLISKCNFTCDVCG